MTARSLAALACAASIFSSTVARADEANTAAAEQLFTEGVKLLKKNDFANACPKFEQSFKLDAALGALQNWAECEVSLGKTATAWVLYRDFAARAASAGKKDREKEARARAAELEPNLCRLQIDAPNDLTVTRDGSNVDPAARGVAVPVDPGEHVVVAQREEGAESRTERVTLTAPPKGPCESKTIVVPASWPNDRRPPKPKVVLAPPVAAPHEDDRLSTRRKIALGIAGLGVVSLGVGGGFGIDAIHKKSDSDAQCFADGCTSDGSDSIRRGQRSADVATVLSITGLVAIGVATVLWLTDH